MNEYRPTRWPCSADSSRNASDCGSVPRSLRNAATGVSQSSMNVWRTGTRLCSRASARTSSRPGETGSAAGSAATAIEHLLRVSEAAVAAVEKDRQVVQDVGRLLVDAVVGLLAGGARDLLGLLLDLRADAGRVVEQLDRVGALRALRLSLPERSLEGGERLVRRRRLGVAVVEAGARAGVARRAGGLDEGEQRVAVAVESQGLHVLDVARGRALVPQLVARAAPQVQLAGLAGAAHGLGVGVGEGEHLSRAPVLHDDRDETLLVVGDVHAPDSVRRRARRRGAPGPGTSRTRGRRAAGPRARAAPRSGRAAVWRARGAAAPARGGRRGGGARGRRRSGAGPRRAPARARRPSRSRGRPRSRSRTRCGSPRR